MSRPLHPNAPVSDRRCYVYKPVSLAVSGCRQAPCRAPPQGLGGRHPRCWRRPGGPQAEQLLTRQPLSLPPLLLRAARRRYAGGRTCGCGCPRPRRARCRQSGTR
jgi:hypothetical protein